MSSNYFYAKAVATIPNVWEAGDLLYIYSEAYAKLKEVYPNHFFIEPLSAEKVDKNKVKIQIDGESFFLANFSSSLL